MTHHRVALYLVLALAGAATGGVWLATRSPAGPAPTTSPEAAPPAAPAAAPLAVPSEPGERPAVAADGVLEVLVTREGAPLENAEVRAYVRHGIDPGTGAPGWRPAGSATTRADGVASLPAAPGLYFLATRAPQLAPRYLAVVRPVGEARVRVSVALVRAVALVGRVRSRRTGEPVPLAGLVLLPQVDRGEGAVPVPAEERTSGTADPLGRFRFLAAPGPYVIEASAIGFARGRIQVTAPRAGVELRLAASAVVEGFVRRADGAPAAGAEVALAGGDELVGVTAGASGGFAAEVKPGTYAVTARGEGAAGAWPVPVTVGAGGRAGGIEIRLGRPGAIAGVVAGADGAPVPGASVAVSPNQGSGEFARVGTDASGRFAVEALGAGVYDVAVSAEGFTPAARSGLALLGGDRVELAIALERCGGVQGTVQDGAGRPLGGVRVRALAGGRVAAPGTLEAEDRTDEAGRYWLGNLDAGRNEIVAAREDASSGASASVEVVAGAWARADFTLPETGRLEGRVSRRDRAPVGRAVVLVFPRGSPLAVASAEVEVDGSYGLRLAAGEYRAHAAPAEGTGRASPADGVSGTRRDLAAVQISPGAVTRLDLVMKGPDDGSGSLAVVQVVEPGGSGSAGAFVLVTTADDLGRAGSSFTDDEGLARVDLTERVDLTGRGGLRVRAYRGGRVGGPVPLTASDPTVVTLRPGATLRGRVVVPEGPPLAGFTLELVSLEEDTSIAGVTGGAAGAKSAGGVEAPRWLEFAGDRFEVADAPAGLVRVGVRAQGGRRANAELALAPGEVRQLELVLDPGAAVLGRAVDARSRTPVAGASVTVLAEGGPPPRPEATTGADGIFSLTSLPTGMHRLRVSAPGYAPAVFEADLGAGADIDLGDLALSSATAATVQR